MKYKNVLITGGAGFIGSALATKIKKTWSEINVISLDNLHRQGSELNVPILKKNGVIFIKGDVRNKKDFSLVKKTDLIIECSAEPSVLAGFSSPEYMIDTNLLGAINCLELAREKKADFIFLSTSRIYPIRELSEIAFEENRTRFSPTKKQKHPGVSAKGITENFPMGNVRSLYGATKLASELIAEEYQESFGVNVVINRFGVVAGPGQFGKSDQGVFAHWLISHHFGKPISYIGFGGEGKQVRDFLHIEDLFEAIKIQMNNMDKFKGEIFNIGGGIKNSASLFELTKISEEITGKKLSIASVEKNRPADVPWYVSDCKKWHRVSGWKPEKSIGNIANDTYQWILKNETALKKINQSYK